MGKAVDFPAQTWGVFPNPLTINLNSKGVSTWNERERISQSAAIQDISDTIMYITYV